jgi:hypothetical protein
MFVRMKRARESSIGTLYRLWISVRGHSQDRACVKIVAPQDNASIARALPTAQEIACLEWIVERFRRRLHRDAKRDTCILQLFDESESHAKLLAHRVIDNRGIDVELLDENPSHEPPRAQRS